MTKRRETAQVFYIVRGRANTLYLSVVQKVQNNLSTSVCPTQSVSNMGLIGIDIHLPLENTDNECGILNTNTT